MNNIAKSLLDLYGFDVIEVAGVNPVSVKVTYWGENSCPKCSGIDLRRKDKKNRIIRHINLFQRKMVLLVEQIKFYCRCCKRYFWQRFQGVLPRNRNTEKFKQQVSHQHHRGITAVDLAKDYDIGHATVTRWYIEQLNRKNLELKGGDLPKVLGIDEHFFTRKRGFATTFCDLTRHKVYDIAMGRSREALKAYFLACKGKQNVKVAVIDLSRTYRSIIKEFLPNALIVADRFHVIRIVNHHFLKAWQLLDPEKRRNIGLTKLMRMHKWNLKDGKWFKLNQYLDSVPALKVIYDFKQDLCRILIKKRLDARQLKRILPVFLKQINYLKNAKINPLVDLGNTLDDWKVEIGRMLRFTKSNGITEGFHNKMEMMSRRAYGFRNFQNYRMKVRVMCA